MKIILFLFCCIVYSQQNIIETEEEIFDEIYYFIDQLEKTNTEDNFPYITSDCGFKYLMTGDRFMIEDQSKYRLMCMFNILNKIYKNKSVKEKIDDIWNDHQLIYYYRDLVCNSVIEPEDYYISIIKHQGIIYPGFNPGYVLKVIEDICLNF